MKKSFTYNCIIVWLLVVFLGANAWAVGKTGTIKGYVLSKVKGMPIPYANVYVLCHTNGAITKENGSYVIHNVPTGIHGVGAMCAGYKPINIYDIKVDPDEVKELEIILPRYVITDATAIQESIGVDVAATSEDFDCELVPSYSEFCVGDLLSFGVYIRNQSKETVYLVRSVPGSFEGHRYPHVIITISGPLDGIEILSKSKDDEINMLQLNDFYEVKPRCWFVPYNTDHFPRVLKYGRFSKPGVYTLNITYSTNDGDIRNWLSCYWTGTDSLRISSLFRKVPKLVIKKSIDIIVSE